MKAKQDMVHLQPYISSPANACEVKEVLRHSFGVRSHWMNKA